MDETLRGATLLESTVRLSGHVQQPSNILTEQFPVSFALRDACMPTLSTLHQTIGKSTRNYIDGDSVTSYPILSYSTGDYVDQTPAVSPLVPERNISLVEYMITRHVLPTARLGSVYRVTVNKISKWRRRLSERP